MIERAIQDCPLYEVQNAELLPERVPRVSSENDLIGTRSSQLACPFEISLGRDRDNFARIAIEAPHCADGLMSAERTQVLADNDQHRSELRVQSKHCVLICRTMSFEPLRDERLQNRSAKYVRVVCHQSRSHGIVSFCAKLGRANP